MRLVTQTHVTAEVFGDEVCIPILKKAGFEALDWSFFGMELGEGIWCTDAWREHALRLKETAAQCGIGFSQAHAPFPTSREEEPYDREIRKRILRAMEAAALMGVRNIVVHPMQELEYATNRDRLWEENLEFYRSLIPYCQEYGIRICAENMWQRDKKRGYIVDSVCPAGGVLRAAGRAGQPLDRGLPGSGALRFGGQGAPGRDPCHGGEAAPGSACP